MSKPALSLSKGTIKREPLNNIPFKLPTSSPLNGFDELTMTMLLLRLQKE